MAEIGNLVDLLLFYTRERLLFNRMVGSMGKSPLHVKSAIALWLALEETGRHNLIKNLHSSPDSTIERLFDDTLKCLEFIGPNASPPPETEDTPFFSGSLVEPMELNFFYRNRDFMYRKYLQIMASVCDRIFGENAAMEVDESGTKPVVKTTAGEGSGLWTVKGDGLNPDADEFQPQHTPEDGRTMFLTFSKGHPLTKEEVVHFFTSKWGEVVEDVTLEKRAAGEDPLCGRVVFTSSLVIPKVLNGRPKAKFLVNRKHLWARMYVPRHRDGGHMRV